MYLAKAAVTSFLSERRVLLNLNYKKNVMTKASDSFILKNKNGVQVTFIARGGQVTSVLVPDKNGNFDDVIIGYDTVEEALAGDAYLGAICGRYANRIAGGKLNIRGNDYQLDINNAPNHLHGGFDGFNLRVWDVSPITSEKYAQAYVLKLVSPDGDQNYPGELSVEIVYGLTEQNEFCIEYSAKTTALTVVNLTSHPYFNLKGAGVGTVEDHQLKLNATRFTPLSKENGTVSGEIKPVKSTPFDFVSGRLIGEACVADDEQIKMVDGIDHNFVIDGYDETLKLAATLSESTSGRVLEVFTDQPGIQLYTGSHFDGSVKGKNGLPILKWGGLAMETQKFPDSPNQPGFPSTLLKPGEEYKHSSIYKFSTK
jgi:aldose 1-epimerase